MRDIRQHKGHGPAENRLYGGGVARDALDDKEVEAYRRRDKTHFRHLDDQNAEPDGIKTQLLYDREENRHGEQDDGHGVHEASQQDHDEQNGHQNDIGVDVKIKDKGCQFVGNAAHGEKISEEHGTQQDHVAHARGLDGFRQAVCKDVPVHPLFEKAEQKGPERSDARGFIRGENTRVEAADNHGEQREHAPHSAHGMHLFPERTGFSPRA